MTKFPWELEYTSIDYSLLPKIPMNHEHGKLGFGQEVPGLFSEELLKNGIRSTFEAIKAGMRTATTRKDIYKKGQLVIFTNKNVEERLLCKVMCDSYPVSSISKEEWSFLEGWDISYFTLNPSISEKYQFRFKYIKSI